MTPACVATDRLWDFPFETVALPFHGSSSFDRASSCTRYFALPAFALYYVVFGLSEFQSKKEGPTMDNSNRWSKKLLKGLNVLLVVAGSLMAAFGIMTMVITNSAAGGDAKSNSPLMVIMIMSGVAYVMLGCFGCWVISKEHARGIRMYALFLVILFVKQLVGGIFALMNSSSTEQYKEAFTAQVEEQFKSYWDSPSAKAYIDSMQTELKCCGLTSPRDYEGRTIPESCCDTTLHTRCTQLQDMYQEGCESKVAMQFEQGVHIGGCISVITSVILLFGAYLAFRLAKAVKVAKLGRCNLQDHAIA